MMSRGRASNRTFSLEALCFGKQGVHGAIAGFTCMFIIMIVLRYYIRGLHVHTLIDSVFSLALSINHTVPEQSASKSP